MDNPVGDTKGGRNWQSTASLLQMAEEACATNSTKMSLQDALEYAQPQGADDEEDTALRPIPTFLVSQKKDVVRKTVEDEIGMFGAGYLESSYGRKEKKVVMKKKTDENEIGMFGAGFVESRYGRKEKKVVMKTA
jgi:hypothetical protein